MAQVLFEIPAKKFQPGTRISDRYQILDVVGKGTVGTVLRARDAELSQEIIALKILHPHLITHEQVFKRFQNEVLICRQLSHPNIVRVYDFDGIVEESLYFLSMECINGPNLREYLDVNKGRCLPFEDAVRILNQLVNALLFAHQKKVIHRDVKPANILLSTDGNVKLTDFGLAQSLQFSHGLTATGETVGTPLYMSPEHFSGNELDPRSDIYSLGILSYEMLTGKAPFQTDNYFALAKQHLAEELPLEPLEQIQTPVWFKDLLCRATNKHPEERFADCRELLHVLNQHASETLNIPRVELNQKLKRRYTSQSPWLKPRLRNLFRILLWLGFALIIFLELMQANAELRLLVPILKAELQWEEDLTPLKTLLGLRPISPLSQNPYHSLLNQDSIHLVRALLLAGVDPNRPDADGNTALHLAAQTDILDLIFRLVEEGAHIDTKNKAGQTPLHLAVIAGSAHSVYSFIQYRADPNIPDKQGNTPLHLSVQNRTPTLINLILQNSQFPIISWRRNKAGETPLHIAVKHNMFPITNLLLERYVNVNLRDKHGRTPLFYALRNYLPPNTDIIGLLLAYGADITARDDNGKSAVEYANSPAARAVLQQMNTKRIKKTFSAQNT